MVQNCKIQGTAGNLAHSF